MNYLYECENDASTLFKCKLCSRLMTKSQALNLKCQLGILNKNGDYIYLHIPDDKFDLTNFLQLLKDKLKTWQNVYWFIWGLIKSFRCKKCDQWFRLVEFNKCRLNDYTFCPVHDTKIIKNNEPVTSPTNNSCYCIHCEHLLDSASISLTYESSPIFSEASASESPEQRLNKFITYVLENFEKHKDLILIGKIHPNETILTDGSNSNQNTVTFCDTIEALLQAECQSKAQNVVVINKNAKLTTQSTNNFESFFIDSITGKHISMINKNLLNLIRLSQSTLNNQYANEAQHVASPNVGLSLDLTAYLSLIGKMDPQNIFNSSEVLHFLRVDNKMKWDNQKPVRLNQDNQREDDLKRFREISNCLIKAKLLEENMKPSPHKTAMVNGLNASYNSSQQSTANSFPGGIYCRIELEWKQRPDYK